VQVSAAVTDINCTLDDALARVTINRPHIRNAMTLAMWKDMAVTFTNLGKNRDVRAIILSSAGDDFSVGADVSEFGTVRRDATESKAYEIAVDACSDAIAGAPQPVISVLRGYCLGGGCHLAMACDFRFAHHAAILGIPAANLSIVYGVRSTKRLLSLVGITNAKRILYSADRLSAREALNIGLIDRVSDEPMTDAKSFASQMAEKAPFSIAGAKYILNQAALGDEGILAEAMIDEASDSEDYREARAAFAENRRPEFKRR
jgi:enoyl-CoA hydratase/carnithine racemase